MTAQTARAPRRLTTLTSRDPARIEAAQRLRYQVFSAEYQSDLGAAVPGLDADRFDDHCDHLLVTDSATGELVATTRVLHQSSVAVAGGFYSEGEFNLDNLRQLPGQLAELGRTCVHPDYRNGATISLLWATVAEYLLARDVDYLIGCASIGMSDGGLKAWRITQQLQRSYLTEPHLQVTPHRALPHLTGAISDDRQVEVPALIRAYMRLGARVCGAPCWDPEFRCADLLVMLDVKQLAGRYSRHFMRRPATS